MELMVVIAIIGIVSAISISALTGLTRKAAAGNFLGEFGMEVANARMLAARRGSPIVLVLNFDSNQANASTNGFSLWAETGAGSINLDDLSTFPPSPTPAGLQRIAFTHIERASIPAVASNTAASIHAGWPFRPLLQGIPSGTQGCSFCQAYGTARRGGLRALPDGRIFFGDNGVTPSPNNQGGGVLLATARAGAQDKVQALAILSPSGMTRVFTQ